MNKIGLETHIITLEITRIRVKLAFRVEARILGLASHLGLEARI